MADTIELTIPKPIEVAARRVMHLIESGYLPAQLKSDLELLMQGAMAWELMNERTK